MLQGLQRTSLPLARFCRALERATSHPVQANAYLTPAGASGLARHVDDHDVLVLQILGGNRTRRQPLALGQLRSILELGDLDGTTVVARRLDHPARIARERAADGRVVLELLDRRLLLPAAMRPALEQLLGEPEVAVGALTDLDEDSQVVLAKRLIRDGLLVVAGRSSQAQASAC